MGWLKDRLNSEQVPSTPSALNIFSGKKQLEIPLISLGSWLQTVSQTVVSQEVQAMLLGQCQQLLLCTNALVKTGERMTDHQQRLDRALALRNAKELEIAKFRADPLIAAILEYKARRDQLHSRLNEHRDYCDHAFRVMRPILEKKANTAFLSDFLQHYFQDPFQALIADTQGMIHAPLKNLQSALDAQQLVVTLKEMELLYAVLEQLASSHLQRIQQEVVQIQSELATLHKEKPRQDLLQKIDDVVYWHDHHQDQVRRIQEEMGKISEEQRDLEVQRRSHCDLIEQALQNSLKENVRIVF